jgi:molybdenum cofactor cytidylyltransferase
MRLAQALRLIPLDAARPARLALVGAGGKTTALFQLGSELQAAQAGVAAPVQTVFLSATTHLGLSQLDQAERVLRVAQASQVETLDGSSLSGLVLFVGAQSEAGRASGLDTASIQAVHALADQVGCPLLVEADGSRRMPLKAPAGHEPPVPPWVDTVVVCAGLSGLGRPLASPNVHRAEIFASLAGLAPGDEVTRQALVKVMTSPQGGLKNIPPGARRVTLLNQADDPQLQAGGAQIAQDLIIGAGTPGSRYQAVLLAQLEQAEPGEGGVLAVFEPAAGVVLAAGAATRYGQPKQLLAWRGEPLVRHAARAGLAAGLDPLVVVCGAYADSVRAALADLPVVVVDNARWQEGQSTSVAAGVQAVGENAGSVVFFLADQPLVSSRLVQALVEQHTLSLAPIVAPLVDGQRGNPVLFDRRLFAELANLSGDAGGRSLFSRYPPAWLRWHEASVLLDIDTVQDYQRLLDSDQPPGQETA